MRDPTSANCLSVRLVVERSGKCSFGTTLKLLLCRTSTVQGQSLNISDDSKTKCIFAFFLFLAKPLIRRIRRFLRKSARTTRPLLLAKRGFRAVGCPYNLTQWGHPPQPQSNDRKMIEIIVLLAAVLGLSKFLASLFRKVLERRRRKRRARAFAVAVLACGTLALVIWASRKVNT